MQNHGNFVTRLTERDNARSRRRNVFLKEKSLESKKNYDKQRNICVRMVKKAKKEHFKLLDITDNKKPWTTASRFFGNKVKTNHKINLIEK